MGIIPSVAPLEVRFLLINTPVRVNEDKIV